MPMRAPHVTVTEGFRWEASVAGTQQQPIVKLEVFDLEAESYACRHGAPPHEQRDDSRQFTAELDTEEFAQMLRWLVATNCALERARSHGRLRPLIQRVAEQSSTLGGGAPVTDEDFLRPAPAWRDVPPLRADLRAQLEGAEDDQAA